MGLGKTYSTRYLADSNGNTGANGQVLLSTPTGVNWANGSDIIGGPYLPLTGGTLTGALYGTSGSFSTGLTTNGILTIQAASPYIQWQNVAGTRLGYIQHNTNLTMNADSGKIVLATPANQDINLNPGGTGQVTVSKNLSVADSARFGGTSSPITIGDGFGYGGSATICKHNSAIYLQYNNGDATSTVNFGGGGTATTIYEAQNASYKLNSGTADSWVAGQGGQFGVGLTNPNAALHVQESSEAIVARFQHSGDGHEAALRIQTIDGTTSRYTDIAQSATTGNLDIRVPYNATIPNLTIKNGGDIGINISDPRAQLHISKGASAPNATAVTSSGVGLVVSGGDGLMDLLSYDDNTTVATSIGMGRYNQTTGNIIDKWGLVTWYDTGNEGSNLSERITLHYGINKLPWSSTGMVTVLRDGNVGIGTVIPFSNASDNKGLNIDRGGHSSLLIGDGANNGGIIQSSDNTKRIFIGVNAYDSPTGSWSRFSASAAAGINIMPNQIGFGIDNGSSGYPTNRMIILPTGNVGIGITGPDKQLTFGTRNDDAIQINGTTVSGGATAVGTGISWTWDGVPTETWAALRVIMPGAGNTHMTFSTKLGSGTVGERMRITDAGTVLIGATGSTYNKTQGYPLGIVGTTTQSYLMIAQSGSGLGNQGMIVGLDGSGGHIIMRENEALDFHTNNAMKMKINAAGNVSIGNSNNTYKLDVSGTIRATGDIIAYSDARVKENIKTIDNALNKIDKLRGVEFNKIGEDIKSIGVIAQEIEKVIPEVVREDDKGMKSVAYGNISGLLIEAIKELKAEIDLLKSKPCTCNKCNCNI